MVINIPRKIHRNKLIRIIFGKHFHAASYLAVLGQPYKLFNIWLWLE